jgi:hypothetical protein
VDAETGLASFRREVTTRSELIAYLCADPEFGEAALSELVRTGRVTEREGVLESANLVLPLGSEQGWEAALLDHFRAVTVALGVPKTPCSARRDRRCNGRDRMGRRQRHGRHPHVARFALRPRRRPVG